MTPVQAAVGTGSRVSAALGRAGQVRVSRVSVAPVSRARVSPVLDKVSPLSRASVAPVSRVPVSRVPVSPVLDKVSPPSRASAAPGSPLSRARGVLDSSAILSGVPSAGIHSGELRSREIHSVEPCSAAASR